MSVLIHGMKMPETCLQCPMQFGGFCYVMPPEIDDVRVAPTVDEAWVQKKPDWCPLVELPEKHGRLIDAEALIDTLEQAIAIMETMFKQLDLEADDGCLMELKAYRDIRDGIKEIDAVIEAEDE